MAKKPSKSISASTFVLQTMCRFPEQEMQVADLYSWCESRYTKANLLNATTRLLEQGKLVKSTEPNRATWYAVDATWFTSHGSDSAS